MTAAAAPPPAVPAGSGGRGGTLYVVSTPIGNLEDVTLRALEVLRRVPLIAAEDTRHTHRLLGPHGITTPTTSYHARSGPGRATALLEHLAGGSDLASLSEPTAMNGSPPQASRMPARALRTSLGSGPSSS